MESVILARAYDSGDCGDGADGADEDDGDGYGDDIEEIVN